MTHCFEVGGKYRNRKGEYEVISISDTNMVIRYSDGSILESPIVDQDRIWRNIQREELRDRLPKPEPKQRGASPGLGRKAGPAGIAAKDADLAVFTRNHGHYLREAQLLVSDVSLGYALDLRVLIPGDDLGDKSIPLANEVRQNVPDRVCM